MERSLVNLETMVPLHDSKNRVSHARFGWATAFVAETYGWLKGRPAVCISALGPGAFNFCFISKPLSSGGAPPRARPGGCSAGGG